MIKILNCRRSSLALIGMVLLFILGLYGVDVASPISAICIGVAGANAGEKVFGKKNVGI